MSHDPEIQQYNEGDTVTFIRPSKSKYLRNPEIHSGCGVVVDIEYIWGVQKTKFMYHVDIGNGIILPVRDRDITTMQIDIDAMVVL